MSKKINKVFLNATAAQIAEYGLEADVSNFTSMDTLIEVVKADLENPKVAERVYDLSDGFTVIDGAAKVSLDLKAIAQENAYRLSAVDFEKVISEATKVIYASEGITDHRILSFESVGEGKIANLNPQAVDALMVERDLYPATAAGEAEYEEAIADAQKQVVDAGRTSGGAIVGYKDLTIENSGRTAVVTTEGEGMERIAEITMPTAVSAIGGETDLDYQVDTTKAVDKKDETLVVENFTEKVVGTTVATGSISVKDSQVADLRGDVAEQVAELKKLHPNEDFADFAEDVNAAGYETVTIDNSTVLGDIIGGSRTVEGTSTGSQETFLDKADLSGKFYVAAKAAPNQTNKFSSDNEPLYSYIDAFKMTEKEAEAKATELGATASEGNRIENPKVNKYEIVELGLDDAGKASFTQIKTGKYVYLTAAEVTALSDANQKKLVRDKEFTGGRTAFAGRQVTDENFTTFTKEPAGNELNKTNVYKYEFTKTEGEKLIDRQTYYLTDFFEALTVIGALGEDWTYSTDYSLVAGYRAAEEITAENFKTEAVEAKVYPAYSDYAGYTFTKEMTAEEADEANKALMAEADQMAWVQRAGSDEKTLFAVEKISGGKEVAYYLTAAELSALGAFGKGTDGKNNEKTVEEVNDAGAFDAATGWVFVDPNDRMAVNADGDRLYRFGAAATEETLASFKELTEANSSTEQPSFYELMDVVYGNSSYGWEKGLDRLSYYDGFESYLGENGEYVIDGEIQYRAAGYKLSGNIQDSAHVSADKKTFNEREYNYSASITASLTEADADERDASPRDGELTQNKLIFKDAYVTKGEDQYLTLNAAQDTYVHNFIDVYAAQSETTSVDLLNGKAGLDTGIQLKDGEGNPLYVKYNEQSGEYEETTEVTDKTCNKVVRVHSCNQEPLYTYSERLTVKVDGKEVPAFWDKDTKQLTAEAKDKEGNDRDEAWFAEYYVVGQQVYKYTLAGDDTAYFMTEAEAKKVQNKLVADNVEGELTKGDAVEGVVHYGELAADADDIKNYTEDKIRVLDVYTRGDGQNYPITKDAKGNPQLAVAEGGVIYSNINGAEFAGSDPDAVYNKFVYFKSIAAEPTYFYTVDEQKSYSDLELAQLKQNEEDAGIATWERTLDKNGLMTWTRTAATGEVSTYTADYATVGTAEKGNFKDGNVATGSIVVKNGSDVRGMIEGYKDVTVQDSKVAKVSAVDFTSEGKHDFSTKKGKVGKDNRQTITTTETSEKVYKDSAIGSFTLSNAADRLTEDGQIEQSAKSVYGYEKVTVTNADVGDFTVEAYESKTSEKTVTDYTGDAADLRADYVHDWRTLANTAREGDGEASYVVSKVTSDAYDYSSKYAAVGSFEATGRSYTFDAADKNRANRIGDVVGYDQVTLTNVKAGAVDSEGKSEYTDKSSYGVKANAKTGKDAVTNSGNRKSTSDSAGTLVASNTVTDAKNENDLTIASIGGYQNITLENVGVDGTIESIQKSTFTLNGSVTEEFDASTMREVNINGRQKYEFSDWRFGAYADVDTWDFQNSKITSAKLTSKDVSTPDAVLTAKGQFSTKAVENEAIFNKYTQASTGRVLFLTEDEAEDLIGDESTESGLKDGWATDAAQFYRRNTETDAEVRDDGLGSLNGTTETAKYTNGKKSDDPEYKEYFFTAKEAKVALLADPTLERAAGDADANRLRSSDGAKQSVTDNTLDELQDDIIGTIKVQKYTNADGGPDYYLTKKEWEDGSGEGGAYYGYKLAEADEDTWFVRRADAGDDRDLSSCFEKEGADELYAYTNMFDEKSVRYATENEFEILVADGKVVAGDYAKGEALFAYRADGNDAVEVDNTNCDDASNAFAAQKASTVFKYDKDDQSYWLTAEEFAALSVKDGVLEGYALDEDAGAKLVMRNEATKAATKDNYTVFESADAQGLVIDNSELYRTELNDEAAAQLGIVYDEENLRAYSANGVDERADAVKTTVVGDINNFKTVALDTMTVDGTIDNGHDTKSDYSLSYSKKLANKKGNDVYTEKFSFKSNSTENAVGSIDLVDTDVLGGVIGYDKVSISTKEATSTIGGIEKRSTTSKHTANVSIVTTDAPAYFSQEKTEKSTDATTSKAKGDLKVAGLKAAEKLVIDQSEHFDTEDEARAEAEKQIAAFGEKKDADIRITGNISGFVNVSLTNVTLGDSEINAYSDKWNSTGGQTTYTLTNNDGIYAGNTTTVVSALNGSTSYSNTIGGSLELINVNSPVTYDANSERLDETPDAARVNTYIFNGKYYALTEDEQEALLPYADTTEGENQARLNASVKTPATEVVEGQSILTVKDFGKAEIGNDQVYYKTSMVVDSDAEKKAYYYVKATDLNMWLRNNEGETADTSTKFYAEPWKGGVIEKDALLTANVSKYTYLDTTVYLTAGEAAILGATATEDAAKYTRLSATGKAVTADTDAEAVKKDDTTVAVSKYIGTDETGRKVYYLTADEFKGFRNEAVLNGTFAKAVDDDTTYQRIGCAAQTEFTPDTLRSVEEAVEGNGLAYGKVNMYSSDGTATGTTLFASAAEFAQLQALDAAYKDYQKVDTGDDVYYLKAATIFEKAIDENLNHYQAVNESAEVFEVSNNFNDAVIGYLTLAEYNTLRDTAAAGAEAFEEIYGIDTGFKYLRVADDTNNLIKVNGIDGEGYVVEAEDTLKPYGYYVAAAEADDSTWTYASGFKEITMVNSALSGADGSLTTVKTTKKLTSKKNDEFGNYTKTENITYKYNVGTFEAVEGVNTVRDDVIGYKTVTLAGKLDEEGEALSTFGSFSGGTETIKNSYSGKVELKNEFYNEGDIYNGKNSEQTVRTSDGTLDAANVTLGDIVGYKDVKIAFDATDDEEVLDKHDVGGITGGNSDEKTTETIKTVGGVRIVDRTTTEKLDAVGTVDVAFADAGDIEGFEKVNVTGSDVGEVIGGKSVIKTVELEMTRGGYTTTSTDTVTEFTAFGAATFADSKAESVTGFKSVAFTGGVEVFGDVSAEVDSYEENPSRGEANTVCYAVTYGYNYARKAYGNTVYLTLDEYKAFVQNENYADAQIDLSASTYREDAEIKNPTADDADSMTWFDENTAESKRDTDGNGYNGANPDTTVVKAYGQDFSIDESGARIGGEVGGYQKVTVGGNSSFGEGYEGTKNADTLVVNANLATFEKLDFGEGKDTLELNGIFGTDVEFKDWNLEEVKGSGKMVVKTGDVDAVKEAFSSIEVVGSDNYAAETALRGLEMDKAIDLGEGWESEVERDEWLGFGDEADYFKAGIRGDLKLEGEIFEKGVATAKVSYDKGVTWETVKSGDEIYAGADIKVFLDEGDKQVSNDYKISIAASLT